MCLDGCSLGDLNETTGQIAAGTEIESYFFHIDSSNNNSTDFIGSITFSSEILGVILVDGRGNGTFNNLSAADSQFGLATVTYPNRDNSAADFDLRMPDGGFEDSENSFDNIRISRDLDTLEINARNVGGIDQLRVFVTAVPEPSTGILAVFMLIFTTHRHRRRFS